jgi:hypothetical protein
MEAGREVFAVDPCIQRAIYGLLQTHVAGLNLAPEEHGHLKLATLGEKPFDPGRARRWCRVCEKSAIAWFEQQAQGSLAAEVWTMAAEAEFERGDGGLGRWQEVKVIRHAEQGLATISWKGCPQLVPLGVDRSGEYIEGCHG